MKKLKHIIIPVVTMSVLFVSLHVFTSKERFPVNAAKAINSVKEASPFLSKQELSSLNSDFTLIVLDEFTDPESTGAYRTKTIPFDQLLLDKHRKILEEQKGKIILAAKQVSVAARAWTILNQLGYEAVFILLQDEKEESFNYTFQPDTTLTIDL